VNDDRVPGFAGASRGESEVCRCRQPFDAHLEVTAKRVNSVLRVSQTVYLCPTALYRRAKPEPFRRGTPTLVTPNTSGRTEVIDLLNRLRMAVRRFLTPTCERCGKFAQYHIVFHRGGDEHVCCRCWPYGTCPMTEKAEALFLSERTSMSDLTE
jgi:hypothetical protein